MSTLFAEASRNWLNATAAVGPLKTKPAWGAMIAYAPGVASGADASNFETISVRVFGSAG